MKKALCVIAALAFAAMASGSVDFWFSSSLDPYGLHDPSKALVATGANGTDYLDGWRLGASGVAPLPAGDVMIDCDANPDAFAYIWARFDGETTGVQINGIAIEIVGASAGQGNIAWYKLNNTNDWGTPGAPMQRWDGDPDVFYFNPAGLIAVTAYGVRNVPLAQDINMYDGVSRTFLLGAVNRDACPDELTFAFGGTPVNYGAAPPAPNPDVNALNKAVFTPEPASLLLLGLAGLMLRRR